MAESSGSRPAVASCRLTRRPNCWPLGKLVEPELPDADHILSIWHINDVGQALENHFNVPTGTLTDDEKWQVLRDVQESLDGSVGINWNAINASIEHLFRDVVEAAQARQEDGQP